MIAPAILDLKGLDLDAIIEAIRDMIARTGIGRLRNGEMPWPIWVRRSRSDG